MSEYEMISVMLMVLTIVVSILIEFIKK